MNLIFLIIIILLFIDFIAERVLDFLNASHRSNQLPEILKDIYDKERYEKSVAYEKENGRFTQVASSFSFAVMLLILLGGGFAIADSWAKHFTEQAIWQAIIYFCILFFVSDFLNMPFSIYRIFVIEEKFGFNKMTPRTYIGDRIKNWGIFLFFGGLLMSLAIWFYLETEAMFWIYIWGVITLVSLFMNMFYSILIVPLFNKQSPLPEGELRSAIEIMSLKAGFKLNNIYVIDGSKRSTKANAYFSGFGAKKRIVLYDTLINDLSTEEVVAVLAHEIGHYKLKHIHKSFLFGIAQSALMLYIFSLVISRPELSHALGVSEPTFHIAFTAFGLLYSPLSMFFGLIMNFFSRKNEYEADAYAASFGLTDQLISALKKLTRKNLSNLTPHPAYVFFYYSHPSLMKRIEALQKLK